MIKDLLGLFKTEIIQVQVILTNTDLFQPKQDEFKAEPMTIRIDDPQKSTDGSFITYRVFTMTALEIYSVDNRPVRRRFRDFLWLHNALTIEFPACVVPPLPEKHRMKYVKGDRFDPMFIEHRRLALQWFMDRIARHPLFQASQYTRLFLESTDFSLVKVKKPDQKFVDMKETIDKFEDNLNIVEKLYSRIGKRQQGLEQHYTHFAGSIRGLSALETNVDQPLRQFAEATESYVEGLKQMREQEDLMFLNDVHELLNYCNATKEQLLERDQKQVQFEDLSTALQSIVLERERVLYPGKNLGHGPHHSGTITEFMTDKMMDNGRARHERLQEEVAKANDENNQYSNQMVKEFEIFQKARESELKQGLAAYADCHIDFYKKSISIWENILPVLNQMQLDQD
ncbi:uncharacterized protein B0P05DRAFT_579104 [Gilbertella persicaria]|uniref:uncharacterized protein n=1 Tax=Gilbertella persicaria TaxID=101096 RepID=UPI00221F93B3|nr:uncharacterized protein B0P05DRAFT_579104 [Gilbertella persicaria]KAI8080173.1 hypothetical protein B0P05DRAFT_579104 [Gilbertella persicaria]